MPFFLSGFRQPWRRFRITSSKTRERSRVLDLIALANPSNHVGQIIFRFPRHGRLTLCRHGRHRQAGRGPYLADAVGIKRRYVLSCDLGGCEFRNTCTRRAVAGCPTADGEVSGDLSFCSPAPLLSAMYVCTPSIAHTKLRTPLNLLFERARDRRVLFRRVPGSWAKTLPPWRRMV